MRAAARLLLYADPLAIRGWLLHGSSRGLRH
jgi:hypothetical protein